MSTSDSSTAAPSLHALWPRWRCALGEVWQRKLTWLLLAVALPVWLALDYQWAGIPLAKTWQVLVVTIAGVLLLAAAGYALRVVFRRVFWGAALRSAYGWLTVLAWLAVGVWVPYKLLWLVFPLSTIAAEAVSAAIRFALADVLATGALLWVAAALAPHAVEKAA